MIECTANPAGPDGHTHDAWIDERTGNGVARPGGDGHMHEIIKGKVLDSGTGHTHELTCQQAFRVLP